MQPAPGLPSVLCFTSLVSSDTGVLVITVSFKTGKGQGVQVEGSNRPQIPLLALPTAASVAFADETDQQMDETKSPLGLMNPAVTACLHLLS